MVTATWDNPNQSNIGPVSSDLHPSKSMHRAPQSLIQLSTKLNVMPAQPVPMPWFFQWWCAGFWSNRLQYHPSTERIDAESRRIRIYIFILVHTVCLEKASVPSENSTLSDGLHSRSLSCAQSSTGHDNDWRPIKHVLLLRLPKAHIESHCNFYRHLGFWKIAIWCDKILSHINIDINNVLHRNLLCISTGCWTNQYIEISILTKK